MSSKKKRALSEHPLSKDIEYSNTISTLQYDFYREIPHDGNCFYWSYAYLTYPFLADREKKQKFLGLTALFEQADASPVAYETYIESLNDLSTDRPLEDLSDDEWNLFIGYLRMAVASYLRIHAGEYAGFIPGGDVNAYATAHVDPMGERAGQIEIIALSKVFDYRIDMVSVQKNSYSTVAYGYGDTIAILHTPDHFEPLYKRAHD